MDDNTLTTIKFFHYVLTPLGFFALSLVIALLLKLINKHKLSTSSALLGLCLLWFCATPVTSNWLQRSYTKKMTPQSNCEPSTCSHDVIMVAGWLQAFTSDDKRQDQFWSERLWTAFQLRKPHEPIIIISSQYPAPEKPTEQQQTYARLQLEKWGVPSKEIHVAQAGRATREAVLNGYIIAKQLHKKQIQLVGYPLRIPRKIDALRSIAKKDNNVLNVNFSAVTYAVKQNKKQNRTLKDFIPSEYSLITSRQVLHEIGGQIAYRLKDWI